MLFYRYNVPMTTATPANAPEPGEPRRIPAVPRNAPPGAGADAQAAVSAASPPASASGAQLRERW